MGAIVGILFLVGGLVSFVGTIMILIEAFKESILWGIGSLIVPFVILAFIITRWEVSKKGFLISLGGVAMQIVGGILGVVLGA